MTDDMTGDRGRPSAGLVAPILIVDDEPVVRALFARVLQEAGYTALEAADGIEALELLERHEVALVLLDSTMPRLDGAGVIRAMRARPATRTLPVILVTAKANLEDRVAGLEAGADDYLAKPVVLDELVARVGAQLRHHAAWTEAVAREAAERRAMTAALRRVRTDDVPEHTARTLVAELRLALGLEGLALASYGPEGALIPLAVDGSWPGRFRPGDPVEAGLARRLRDRVAHGPWVLDHPARGGDAAPGLGTVAALPLEGSDGPFGLLALRVASAPDGARAFARRMPLFLDLADLVAALLRPGLEADAAHRHARAALEGMIAARAFVPYFQPVVSLTDRSVVGHEALTRFSDGTAPDTRFADAARLGLSDELERATLAAAVGAADGLPGGTFLALNVSPSFVLGADLSELLPGAGRDIVLEITEHAPVHDYAALRAALERLGPRVRVAVDDAGSGYASLRHILALRPAFVKLDMGWVRDIDADPARQALVAGLVHFAVEVGCALIGEGIETEAERATLRRLGVTLGQGYLFRRPASLVAVAGGPTASASGAAVGA